MVCDGAGVASFLSKNMRERKRLESEELEAEEALEAAMARLARIRKQKRLLKKKGEDLVSRGLQGLEGSGVLAREEPAAVSEAASLGAFDLIDWNAVGLEEFSFPSAVVGESSSAGAAHG